MNKLNEILTFGKYKGKTVSDVLDIDAQYLEWLLEIGMLEDCPNRLEETIREAASLEQEAWFREIYYGEIMEY